MASSEPRVRLVAATALRRLGEPLARVAPHLVVAAQPGHEEEAIEVLSQAVSEMFTR